MCQSTPLCTWFTTVLVFKVSSLGASLWLSGYIQLFHQYYKRNIMAKLHFNAKLDIMGCCDIELYSMKYNQTVIFQILSISTAPTIIQLTVQIVQFTIWPYMVMYPCCGPDWAVVFRLPCTSHSPLKIWLLNIHLKSWWRHNVHQTQRVTFISGFSQVKTPTQKLLVLA